MTFEIGDKVQTNSGLYIGSVWREAGFKGKVVRPENAMGLVTVKFKGIDDVRFMRPEYIILRKKTNRPFKKGDTVALTEDVSTNAYTYSAGYYAEVLGLIPDSNLVIIKFLSGTELTVAEAVLSKTEVVAEEEETPPAPDFDEKSLEFAEDSPEVQEALALILARIEDIVALLTAGPKQEIYLSFNEAPYFDGTSHLETEEEPDPEPEPVFKKAKEVNEGDSLYTEAGAWDKVNRVETKDSGYTSLYGVFGNKIAQVPSGRVVQVLEPVS